MSDEQEPSRMAEIKIMRVQGTNTHRIEAKFLGHITASIRWDDSAEDARNEVLALLRDAQAMAKNAFIEIDVDNEKDTDLDAEWAYYQDEDPEPEDTEDEDEA